MTSASFRGEGVSILCNDLQSVICTFGACERSCPQPHSPTSRDASDVAVAHLKPYPETNVHGRPRHDHTIASRPMESEMPDGGYGWVVVLSCAVMFWWFGGITYSWGVFQNVLVQDRLSSASTLSLVGSLTVACLSIFAIINARLIRLLGARRTALLGVLFFGGGQILSSFTTDNIAGLFATTGVTMGIGARHVKDRCWSKPATLLASNPVQSSFHGGQRGTCAIL